MNAEEGLIEIAEVRKIARRRGIGIRKQIAILERNGWRVEGSPGGVHRIRTGKKKGRWRVRYNVRKGH